MSPRLLASLVVALAVLIGAAPARADWFASEPIDGPSADVLALGGIDLARDGRGAVVYLKRETGVARPFFSRLTNGAFGPPERADGGVPPEASEVAVATADEGRLVVAWIAGGRVWGAFVAGGAAGGLVGPTELGGDPGGVRNLAVDMGINGTAYVVWSAGTGDVRAARLRGTTWEGVGPSLDIDPARSAGTGRGAPRVAVSAEGNAVAVWGEGPKVYGRRLTGLVPSAFPQEVSLPGGSADSPDVDIEDDGSYAWAVWRQDLGDGSRSIARRLVGSLFEAPAGIDLGPGSAAPRMELTGRGVGVATTSAPGGAVSAAVLENDVFAPPVRLDAVGAVAPAAPVVAVTEREQMAVVWRRDGALLGRYKPTRRAFAGEAGLARRDLGPVAEGAYDAAADRIGDVAVAALQGDAAARTITAAVFDRPPARALLSTSVRYQRVNRPRFIWRPGLDLWGAQRFTVFVDGREIGTTEGRELIPAEVLGEGVHRWRVVATDRRGQQSVSRDRTLRVDTVAPAVSVRVTGARRAGGAVRVSVSAQDAGGSGLGSVRVAYGDGRSSTRSRTVHRYRAGRYALAVRVADRAGNVAQERVAVVIRRRAAR